MIFVAVGANLPGRRGENPIVTCRAAVQALRDLPDLNVAAVSRWYLTDPVPPSGQPSFVNGVVRLTGAADPAWLLGRLLGIEAVAGRTRGEPNAARILDLDLLAMGDVVRAAPDPILPHPRAHQRAFVLAPWADVAAGWRHPALGLGPAELLAALPREGWTLL